MLSDSTNSNADFADTGSANDLVSREMVKRNEVFESNKPVSLLTANGVFQANDQAKLKIPLLGITANLRLVTARQL